MSSYLYIVKSELPLVIQAFLKVDPNSEWALSLKCLSLWLRRAWRAVWLPPAVGPRLRVGGSHRCWGSWQRPIRLASSRTLWGGWQLVIGCASDVQWSPTISVTVYKQQEAKVLPDCGGVFWRYFRGTPLTHMRTSTEAWRRRIPALDLLDLIGIILDKALSMWSDLSLMPVLLFSCQVCLGVWDCISYLCSIQQRLIQWEWTAVTSGAKCWPQFERRLKHMRKCFSDWLWQKSVYISHT